MRVVNLLEFLNTTKDLYALNYARCDFELINFLNLLTEDEQFTQNIDLGVIFVNQRTFDQFTIIDGLNRILSLSLLLHAVCECYKKTTPQNDKAIKTIRSKYLMSYGQQTKLRLSEKDAIIYSKTINGKRLSGKEKQSQIFKLLHDIWSQIKSENLQAANIFSMLKKISVSIVETEAVPQRDLYYKLNCARDLNQILLIEDFLKSNNVIKEWNVIKEKYFPRECDLKLFLKDFLVTKFNYRKFDQEKLYINFANYFETMSKFMSKESIMDKVKHSALLYCNILNVNFVSEEIKKAFIDIKKASGDDTYAYILDVYNDLSEGNISESTFIEILNTIADYLKNRKNSDNNIAFNELIQYLNAFITCK